MNTATNFNPDWISPPGETIRDILAERKLSIIDFATRIGQTHEQFNELLVGRRVVTTTVARELERNFGAPAQFWLTREAQYREALTRRASGELGAAAWLRELPIADMVRFGWIESQSGVAEKVRAILQFFGVGGMAAWREQYREPLELAAFRTSTTFAALPGAVAAWLRQGELVTMSLECAPWNPARFREMLTPIRKLTRRRKPSEFLPELIALCAACGVAVGIVRAPSGCRASGATRFLSNQRASILLSMRYLSDDHFWFTFFHEAGHLILHQQKLFLETDDTLDGREEQEANEFSSRTLIPDEFRREFERLRGDKHEIRAFALRIGVSPGIVVGQLQHLQRLRPDQMSSLKARYSWS